jgi:hypothetical protein
MATKKVVASKKDVVVKEDEIREVTKKNTVRILIHKTAGDQGSNSVQVGVNGKLWLIQRGEEVEVPVSVERALHDAVSYDVGYDPATHSNPVSRVQAYPYSIVG